MELARLRHQALDALRAGDRDRARELLRGCAVYLHQAVSRGVYRWPGEYAAMVRSWWLEP